MRCFGRGSGRAVILEKQEFPMAMCIAGAAAKVLCHITAGQEQGVRVGHSLASDAFCILEKECSYLNFLPLQPSVRKQHNAGYKHKANVRSYYQQFEEQQTQSLIDQRIKEHLGQAAAFQVGATFNQHLMTMPGARPPLPLLIPPMLPIGASPHASMNAPLQPGVRPPVLPPPFGVPGYGAIPPVAAVPSAVGPPGAPTTTPMQPTNLPRPPTLPPPISGAMAMPTTNTTAPAIHQGNPSSAPTTSFESFNAPSGSTAP
ncbi:hypothetical protein ZIOFF_032522 [Zingiber officinale]|uniref:U1-C C2H2-type zinc finger domain-containing protein n=1 Tax=Zingiber officinale TaxID=94328 RepID=A0A8J5GJ48_ZINOF|nr:hypothetical protein ZIOFF_032522 [Zingiber officinale]